MVKPRTVRVEGLNLSTTAARESEVTKKLLQMVAGKYLPADLQDWADLRRGINSILYQPDRVKLIALYNEGRRVVQDYCTFNPMCSKTA